MPLTASAGPDAIGTDAGAGVLGRAAEE